MYTIKLMNEYLHGPIWVYDEEGFIRPRGIKFREGQDPNIKLPKVAIGVFSSHLYKDIVEKFIVKRHQRHHRSLILF